MPAAREQFNCRLPAFTKKQIASLAERMGLSQSEVVILAIDRLTEATGKPKEKGLTAKNKRQEEMS